jgi:Na+/proline symporter
MVLCSRRALATLALPLSFCAECSAKTWEDYESTTKGQLVGNDWILILVYVAIAIGIAIYHSRQAGKSTKSFFQANRDLPWWLAGTSMAATSFGSDMPLAITELTAKHGIAGNWMWWSMAMGTMSSVFFFAKLWQRSGVLTDVAIVEMRYDGVGAAWLRAVKAFFFGIFMTCLSCGWAAHGMETVLKIMIPDFPLQPIMLVAIMMVVAASFSLTAGLKGVVMADNVEIFIGVLGAIVLANLSLYDDRIGGLTGLMSKLPEQYFHLVAEVGERKDVLGWTYSCPDVDTAEVCSVTAATESIQTGYMLMGESAEGQLIMGQQQCASNTSSTCAASDQYLPMFVAGEASATSPDDYSICRCAVGPTGEPMISTSEITSQVDVLTVSAATFVAHFCIQWWASWYPGAEPGGGGYIAQRMRACKTDRDAQYAVLWYALIHYCVRPWPWIITALVAQVLFKDLDHPAEGYVLVMREVLPDGARGLVFAGMVSAFMSTIATQLNWGSSIIVEDCFRRFLFRNQTDRTYVFMARVTTIIVGVIAIFNALMLTSIVQAWEIGITATAGLGSVMMMRWYWWRINAWSELTATLVPVTIFLVDGLLQVRWIPNVHASVRRTAHTMLPS